MNVTGMSLTTAAYFESESGKGNHDFVVSSSRYFYITPLHREMFPDLEQGANVVRVSDTGIVADFSTYLPDTEMDAMKKIIVLFPEKGNWDSTTIQHFKEAIGMLVRTFEKGKEGIAGTHVDGGEIEIYMDHGREFIQRRR